MNQKKVGYDGPMPTYLHEVKINSRRLLKGMEATLHPERGKKEKRRWEFRYAENVRGQSARFDPEKGLVPTGPVEQILMLTFYGPVRSARQKFRTVRSGDVLTVHAKSEARA